MRKRFKQGRERRLVPQFKYPFPQDAWDSPSPFPARPYQQGMVQAIWEKLSEYDSTLLVSPTGTGKTVMFGHLCRLWPREMGRICVLVHRDELLDQATKKIRAICPYDTVENEAGSARASRSGSFSFHSRIVVASKDSLWRENRLTQFPRDAFGLIICDEAQHCTPRAKSYWNIIEYFSSAYLCGVTATPDRRDEEALGQSFTSVAMVYDIADAIDDGWLVPIVQQYLTVEDYDLSNVRSKSNGSDLDESELDQAMRKEKVLHGIVDATIDLSNKNNRWGNARQTLVFACSVAHAKSMADIFNRHHAKSGTGLAAVVANDIMTRPERRDIIERFRKQEIRYLVNCLVFSEGFDVPGARIVVIARPTKSRSLYSQMVGRGTRPHDDIVVAINNASDAAERRQLIYNSTKPSCLIVDPVGNSGAHKLITCPDVLAGFCTDDDVENVKKVLQSRGTGRGDVLQELVSARRAREEAESARRKDLIIKAKYSTRYVDPFDLFDVHVGREPGWFKGKPASEKQKAFLEKSGLKAKQIDQLSMHRASILIDQIIERRKAGKATYGQMKVLSRYGYDDSVTFTEAKSIIDDLAKQGWPSPEDYHRTN